MTPVPPAGAAELLAELVAIPSVNPGADPDAPLDRPLGEARLAAWLAARLREWGAEVTLPEVLPGRPNVIARFAGRQPERVLLFEAHMDTVAVAGMSIPPFEPAVRDGRLYGRGACDTKGPMAAMLAAIRRVQAEDGDLPLTVIFAGCCDEELGARGSRALAATPGLAPDLAVIAEPTDLGIVHAHKGTIRWRIRTRGVAAHSSAPERGVNAIYRMAHVLAMLENDMMPRLGKRQHPLLGPATVSAGTIRGGTQVNVVPDACELGVDRRLLPGETPQAATAEMRALLEAMATRLPGFEADIEPLQFYEPLELDPQSAPCRVVAAACEQALGAARFTVAPWSSDGGVMAAAGWPAVVIGPGSIHQAHTHDECIELNALERGVDLYAAIIRQGATPAWPTTRKPPA